MKDRKQKAKLKITAILTAAAAAAAGCAAGTADIPPQDINEEGEILSLLCLADSREQAEEIADVYQVTLISFQYGVALFESREPLSVINKRGKGKKLPKLEINHEVYASDMQTDDAFRKPEQEEKTLTIKDDQ